MKNVKCKSRKRLNPSRKCFIKFTLSLVDKVTIGTCNLASVISNFTESPALGKIQPSIQFSSRWTLQFINGISNDLQNLLKYFNGTTIFVSFTKLFPLLWFSVLPARAAFYLKDSELSIVKSAIFAGTSSLLYCHKLPDVSE